MTVVKARAYSGQPESRPKRQVDGQPTLRNLSCLALSFIIGCAASPPPSPPAPTAIVESPPAAPVSLPPAVLAPSAALEPPALADAGPRELSLVQPTARHLGAFEGPKPAPHLVPFLGCSGDGEGPEVELNRAKNRDDDPGAPDTVAQMSVQEFSASRDPEAPKGRTSANWAQVAGAVAKREGYPLALTGILLHARGQQAEECNCKSDDPRLHDVHINLVGSAGEDVAASVIVEVTPRIRALHPKWIDTNLKTLVKREVRVTGWVTFDNEHRDMITKGTRKTRWEIHPILHFEVKEGGGWKDVDDVL